MDQQEWMAERFEANRPHLRQVAYRMLGSPSEADDAVQEAWLRLSRSGTSGVENLGGWLTTVVARVCLDMLRSRKSRRAVGIVVAPRGRLLLVLAFRIVGGKIVEIDVVGDPERLRKLELGVLGG
jgi:DNA-directed RNA polymerase specialized sigma24 family protein